MGILDWVVTQTYISDVVNDMIKRGVPMGVACTSADEPIVSYDQAQCETVIGGNHNCQLVFGKDRPESKLSGKGGKGATGCGMIDLVVGRAACASSKREKAGKPRFDSQTMVGPMFAADAARIYITQKTDDGGIDSYLGIDKDNVDNSGLSAIAIKADGVRVVGRHNVRIMAGGGNYQGFGNDGEHDSLGDPLVDSALQRIELIAGPIIKDSNIQPTVLGNNLVTYLKEKNAVEIEIFNLIKACFEQLSELHGIVLTLSAGTYPPGYARLIENISKVKDIVTFGWNTKIDAINSLNDAFVPGSESIISDRVFIT